VTGFAHLIDDGPMILALLEMLHGQLSQLPPPQSTTQNRSIPLALQCGSVWQVPKHSSFVRGQPISEAAPKKSLGSLIIGVADRACRALSDFCLASFAVELAGPFAPAPSTQPVFADPHE
jgi:hypothetical protein